MEQLILNNITDEEQYYGISGMTLEPITLKKKLVKGGKTDSDGDKVQDIDDPRPTKYDVSSILLFQSKKEKVKDEEGKIPLDMTTGDFSKKKIDSLHAYFKYQLASSVDTLQEEFKILIKDLSIFEIQKVGLDMINKFMECKGADYSNKILTEKFKNHSNTKKFTEKMEKKFKEILEENKGELIKLLYNKGNQYDRWVQENIRYPKFTKISDNINGMGILIHDIWSYNIRIKNYKVTKEKYSGIMQFTFYDHFGLDEEDMTKIIGGIAQFSDLSGFRSWFTLQHYTKYNNKYNLL